MDTCERTIGTLVHVRYKQPRTRGTHAQAELCTSVRIHAKVQKVHQYTCTLKHPRALTRCTVPVVHTKHCTSTSTHVHYVRRSGCTCRTLYKYKYSVYVQAQVLVYTTDAAQVVHTKHCTCTCTLCTPKHAGLRTIGHRSNCPCRTLYTYTYRVHATREHSRAIGAPLNSVHVHVRCTHDRCTAQIAHAEHCANTRPCFSARQVHRYIRKCRKPYTHAYTHSRR